jgi:hypothetical protein
MSEVLARSPVYRRLPAAVRARLDRALLSREEGRGALDRMHREFELAARYGITPGMLRAYASRLEDLMRPVVTSQVIAGVLGSLSRARRRQLVHGSEILLISRLVAVLNADPRLLPVPQLARLGGLLVSLGRETRSTKSGRTPAGDAGAERVAPRGDPAATDPIKMAESVRLLYGISYPPRSVRKPNSDAASADAPDGNETGSQIGWNREGCPHVHPEEGTC